MIVIRGLDSVAHRLGFPSYLCLLATAINVDTFCDVSKLHFLLWLNKDIKRPNPPPSWGD